jgi:hypothetical protein
MVLKGDAAVPQQAGLVPLSDDAGKVEAVREGVTRIIALDYVPSGDKSNPILSGVMNAPIVPAPAIVEACGGNRALIGRRAGWPYWRRLGWRTRGSVPTVLKAKINFEYCRFNYQLSNEINFSGLISVLDAEVEIGPTLLPEFEESQVPAWRFSAS